MSECKHKNLRAQSCPDCGESLFECVQAIHKQVAQLETKLKLKTKRYESLSKWALSLHSRLNTVLKHREQVEQEGERDG